MKKQVKSIAEKTVAFAAISTACVFSWLVTWTALCCAARLAIGTEKKTSRKENTHE